MVLYARYQSQKACSYKCTHIHTSSVNDDFNLSNPTTVLLMMIIGMRYCMNGFFSSSIQDSDPISVLSQSLPITTKDIQFDVSSFISPMLIGFAFTLIPAGLTMDLVHDREVRTWTQYLQLQCFL